MQKTFLLLFSIFFCINSYALIPETTRREYALKFHEAFVLQSVGQSTQAFNRFLEAFHLGTDAGESSTKLQVIANLFYWYRQHGACMKLFGKQPSSKEQIHGEYCNCKGGHASDEKFYRTSRRPTIIAAPQHGMVLAAIPDYRSEYGTNPQQAALVRDFVFGAGEVIAGVLLVCVGKSVYAAGVGLPMVYSGVKAMWNSGNMLWAQHESALIELKKLTDQAEAAAK